MAGKRVARRGGGFALQGESAAAPLGGAAAAGPLGGLLALQEAVAPEPAERRARRRASAALSELTGLQLELLGGTPDPARLARLQQLAELEAAGADPLLAAVLREVALRARVELARRRFGSGASAV
jgi:hypothetical protein